MSCGLRPTVPGEYAFLVAVDSHDDWWPGGEIGEVPDVFAHDRVDPIEHPVVGLERVATWYSSLHTAASMACRPDMASAPYSVTRIGLPMLAAHACSSASSPTLGCFEIARLDVPAVVAVDHHDISELGEPCRCREGKHHVHEADRPGWVALRAAAKSGSK